MAIIHTVIFWRIRHLPDMAFIIFFRYWEFKRSAAKQKMDARAEILYIKTNV